MVVFVKPLNKSKLSEVTSILAVRNSRQKCIQLTLTYSDF